MNPTEERHGTLQHHQLQTNEGALVLNFAPSEAVNARAAARRANAEAKKLGIKARYRVVSGYADGYKELMPL
jgi:hypothetical protein